MKFKKLLNKFTKYFSTIETWNWYIEIIIFLYIRKLILNPINTNYSNHCELYDLHNRKDSTIQLIFPSFILPIKPNFTIYPLMFLIFLIPSLPSRVLDSVDKEGERETRNRVGTKLSTLLFLRLIKIAERTHVRCTNTRACVIRPGYG